jgi:uncharacterized protein
MENAMPPPSASHDSSATVVPSSDERTMAMLCHLLNIFAFLIGPIIIWAIKKNESAFVDRQGKEAINFAITAAILYVAVIVLSVVTFGFGALLFPVVAIAYLVFCILAAIETNKGTDYRYPFALRLIK